MHLVEIITKKIYHCNCFNIYFCNMFSGPSFSLFPAGDMPEIMTYLLGLGKAILWSSKQNMKCKVCFLWVFSMLLFNAVEIKRFSAVQLLSLLFTQISSYLFPIFLFSQIIHTVIRCKFKKGYAGILAVYCIASCCLRHIRKGQSK